MKHKKGLGFNKVRSYLEPINVMAGTEKVRTYKEWEELLKGDLGKACNIIW